MSGFVFVKPAEGGRVRMPDRNSAVMPAEGITVPRIDYYERLILAGDVIVDEAKTKEENQRIEAAQRGEPELGKKHPASDAREAPAPTVKK